MKKHTVIGRDALAEAEARTGFRSAIFEVAKEIAYSHQEKWDGSGYPEGLAGDRIPLSARIMAISDVYDALISKRVYKGELTHEEAVEIINAGSGKHFDPVLIDAFNRCAHKFRDIANEYKEQ